LQLVSLGVEFMSRMFAGMVFVLTQILPIALAQDIPAAGASEQESKPALQLILSPDDITVVPNGEFTLSVKLINNSKETIWCTGSMNSSGIDEEYTYDIRTRDGKPVPRIRMKGTIYPSTDCAVGPGESFDKGLPGLMRAFDFSRPGVYTIQVSCPDWAHPEHRPTVSNIVRVTVKTPK